jgi:undecaprenyl-diphosphatase
MRNNLTVITKMFCIAIAVFYINTSHAQNWDINLLKSINPNPPSGSFWKVISSSAQPLSVGIPAGMFAIGLINKDSCLKSNSIEILASLTATALATGALKIAINRQRPYQKYPFDIFPYDGAENGQSFPSAHTSLSFATATSLSLIYKKWYVTVPAFVWATGVGYSRLYLGQHYPSDVIVGAAVGTAGAYAGHWLNKKLFRRK